MKLTAMDATGTKQWQIGHLGDPSPMEDVPDQDSAKVPETRTSNFVLLTRAILGVNRIWIKPLRGRIYQEYGKVLAQ